MATKPVTQPPAGTDVLAQVREGMAVYDRNDKKVGQVGGVFLGAAADQQERPGVIAQTPAGSEPIVEEGVLTDATELLDPDGRLPEVLRKRLRYNGFVRIKTGPLRSDCYALREHVVSVDRDRVRLGVDADELIKA